MIIETKMAVASVIRNVLNLSVKNICSDELTIGDYFEYLNKICVYIGDGFAIDEDGFKIKLDTVLVRPVRVKLEYDYVLLREDGTEASYL